MEQSFVVNCSCSDETSVSQTLQHLTKPVFECVCVCVRACISMCDVFVGPARYYSFGADANTNSRNQEFQYIG